MKRDPLPVLSLAYLLPPTAILAAGRPALPVAAVVMAAVAAGSVRRQA